MLFNSYVFLCLLISTFIFYYIPKLSRFQVYVLVISSFIFYAYNEPILILLLIFSPAVNIIISYYITYAPTKFSKRAIVTVGVISEIAVLAFFKYSPLISKTFFNQESSIGQFLLMIPLPIGISFFTFEGISLVVDVYTEKYFDRTKYVSFSLLKHAKNIYCFISFFPHLIAGPIVKAHDFLPQINVKKFREIDWLSAFKSLVTGYFLKMFIADNLKDFTFWIAYPYFQGQTAINLIVMLLGYSCQIFADFAGYSLIAIGLAKLFGYNLMVNFNYPYIATSFKEFWKRWHISLSSYLMEYLYIPLGGSKKGRFRTYINLMITMFIGGMWHGAAWSYAVWGSFHGIALVTERIITEKIKIKSNLLIVFFKRLMVFLFVTFAWLLFKLPEFSHVIEYFRTIFRNSATGYDFTLCANIIIYSFPIFFYHLLYLLKEKESYKKINKFEYVIYGIMLFLIFTNSGSSGTFIYFQF